jgi:acetate kinase
MQILVINCGSSSVKVDVIEAKTGNRILSMLVDRMVAKDTKITFSDNSEEIDCPMGGHEVVLNFAFPKLLEKIDLTQVKGVGHRVAHGGDKFDEPAYLTEEVEAMIEELNALAPLHNPPALLAIRMAKKFIPEVPHIAVFDTAFHATLPKRAQLYALPQQLTEKYAIRRYGFHGTSHQFVAKRAADYLKSDIRNLRMITCHLGNGGSICAVEYGRSVETSMGMTPLEGLVMGTRSGDIDPGILLYLMEKENMDWHQLNVMLNKESGLKGLSSYSNDMRDITEKAAQGDENSRMAIHVFTHRIRKYIGAYVAVMGGVDAIVFSGGIGENSAVVRSRTSQRLDFLGAFIDEDKNRDLESKPKEFVEDISMPHSRCKILVVETDEQYAIAQQTSQLIDDKHKVNALPTIPIAVSARHAHLNQEAVELLFGEGYQLTRYKDLSQPGQFACNETITLVGPKNKIENVRILGPVRSKNQIEISRTDEFFLGIDAPVRESGHTEGSAGITVYGNVGKMVFHEGVICAWRHIHMTPEDAEVFQVKDRDVVEVRIENQERSLTFGNVIIRVSKEYKLEMHIDTDEANAAELNQGAEGALIATSAGGHLTKRNTKYDEV